MDEFPRSPLAGGFITSTRLYDVAPGARAAWADLLAEVHARAGVSVQTVQHGWPTPIGELWQRPGLAGAFMCGWPFVEARHAGRDYAALAGVVPAWPHYEGLPRYRSEFLVRADSPWTRLEESFGSRYGWMVKDSQSGWNAPRAVLARHAATRGGTLYAESRGPYGNPRGLLRALAEGEIDITAVDAWYLDLMREHDPAALTGLRTLAYTPWTPNPLIVSGPDVPADVSARLSAALTGLDGDAQGRALLRAAHVARFVPAEPQAYSVLRELAEQAERLGYPEIR